MLAAEPLVQDNIAGVKNEPEINPEIHHKEMTTAAETPFGERSGNSYENMNVDIIEDNIDSDSRLSETEDPDATEYSSSFADTTADVDIYSTLSDAEVESHYFGESEFLPDCDAFGTMFHVRKKRLTNHWRAFIHPLMWRCKWTELRIKELESQGRKYLRLLEEYEQRKLQAIEPSVVEAFGSRSLLYGNPYNRKDAKRRKRKRVESKSDISSYMSQHNLFSYVEMKKSTPDGATFADDTFATAAKGFHICKERSDSDNDDLLFEAQETDSSLEQALHKIENVHYQVNKLKIQLDLLLSKHAARFSSSENLSLLAACDAQTSSGFSPAFSAGDGDAVSAGAIYSPNPDNGEYDIGKLVLPEGVSSVLHVPDIIESTVGLLSSAEVTLHQPQIGDLTEDILDNVLIQNETVEAERDAFMGLGHQLTDEDVEAETKGFSEQSNGSKSTVNHEQFVLESYLGSEINVPRTKRKRGERKAGSWSKKHPGDLESE